MTAHLHNVQLNDYTLWFDGTITVDAETVTKWLVKYPKSVTSMFVTETTPEIKQYNKTVEDVNERLIEKTSIDPIEPNWPSYIKDIDVEDHLFNRLADECACMSASDMSVRVKRVADEMQLFKKKSLLDVLKALIYIINTLEQHNVVWGVGRGSSVSSYVLYLIKVHDVDSVEYCLDIHDFLR